MAVDFLPGQVMVMSEIGREDRNAIFWDLTTGKATDQIRMFPKFVDPENISVTCPASVLRTLGPLDRNSPQTPDRNSSPIREWTTNRLIQRFKVNEAQFSCATCSPDDKWVLTGGRDSVTLWDTKTGREVRRFEGHTSEIVSVYFSGDGSMFVWGAGTAPPNSGRRRLGATSARSSSSRMAPGRSWTRMGGSIPILWNRSTDFTGSSPTNPNGRYLSSYICVINYEATPPSEDSQKGELPEITTTWRVEPHQPSVAFETGARGAIPPILPWLHSRLRAAEGRFDGTTASLFRRQMFMIFVYSAMATRRPLARTGAKRPPETQPD